MAGVISKAPGQIILCPNAESDVGYAMTLAVKEMLEKRGIETIVCPVFEDGSAGAAPRDIVVSKLEDCISSSDMVITFGGDGTILRAARAAAEPGVPILGVNMGGKGFMAELEVGDIELLDAALSGSYSIEHRMMLDVAVTRNEKTLISDFALNDVVIRGDNKVIDLTLYGDGQRITGFSGDGAVIATPTGSTAYSMSAGGPIVEPSAHNIILTPICAHVIEAKSFVLAPERNVSVEIGRRKHNPAYISVDGGDHVGVRETDSISIRKSGRSTKLVRLSERSFYQTVYEKLGALDKTPTII
ncbi:MAG: NAD(+)/NADH kinase [Oscillospiraceae bacterium]|nr:NAD(+)/NADH kinase [Oscillospiraceae bacterium]